MDKNNNFPFVFNSDACATCGGKCCRGSAGHVWVSEKEVEKLAENKDMDATRFAKLYLRRAEGRLSLQERVINGDHLCCFLDPVNGHCTVYEDRPEQCKTFPFWDSFMTDSQPLFLECPGVSSKESA